ncbi:CotH kinase family protein [Nonomuraea fuscirosea]|jgi:spore coat protein CotH|uniref:CotH kinase family protein n=1 Tax=Nonomuraea fuscirosea TaxID=1291556 RepID=UPI0034276A19
MAQPKRLKHRVPVKLRQHWKLVALCAAFLATCWGVLGSGTIRPYVTASGTAGTDAAVRNLTGSRELFDASAPHQVTLTFRDESYQDMLSEYFKDGDKKYVEADLTIDGTRIPSVGIRLKGNSTLQGLTWKGQSRVRSGRAGGMPGGQPPDGLRPPNGFPPPDGQAQPDGQTQGNGQTQGDGQTQNNGQTQNGADQPGGWRPGGFGASLKAEEPENLPWLISFDEFVEGRRYQGHTQLAVRPAAAQSSALLNEALAIAMVGAAGEPTQRSAYASFAVNGRASAPRLLVEYLDERYAERLGHGVLYKSLASSRFAYQGEDQTEYVDDFKQVNLKGERDLQPVIDLIRWVERSSAEEFATGLAARLDVESFARYVALQNLLLNFDDMAGPGRNYYLWYDLDTARFKVISWDLNFAFSGDATAGPDDTITMGSPRTTQSEQPQARQRAGGPGGGMRIGHALKEKFLADAGFKNLYEREYATLYRKLLGDGTATGLLDQALAAYGRNEGADTAKADKEAATLRKTLETRTEALKSLA